MIASGSGILELIPQRPPVVMIDKLLFSDHQKTVSALTINSSCIFCENGFLSESGMVENIAQTAAAGVGYICKKEKIPVPLGYIAAIEDLKIVDLPRIGTEINTEVNIQNKVLDVTIVKGIVTANDELLAECEMRIFIKPD